MLDRGTTLIEIAVNRCCACNEGVVVNSCWASTLQLVAGNGPFLLRLVLVQYYIYVERYAGEKGMSLINSSVRVQTTNGRVNTKRVKLALKKRCTLKEVLGEMKDEESKLEELYKQIFGRILR